MPKALHVFRPPAIGGRLAAQAARRYERQDWRAEDKRFYGARAWRRLRAQVLREQPLCADCARVGIVKASEHVHHILDRKARPDLALERSNLEGLCLECHNRKRGDQCESA